MQDIELETSETEAIRPRWVVPMKPRSPNERHRVATPLELFFDLVIVVAVAQVASAFHHQIVEGHFEQALVGYGMAFFGIWWAWMNFTWFSASYDNDDVPYRLTTFVQMTGALILATGAESIFNNGDLTIPVVGYVVMRIAGITQWIRAARSDPDHRPAALRYALGIGVAQVAWIILVFTPSAWHVPGFILLAIVELLVPVWAERSTPTTWHSHHIRERYGLFTLLVLGESILSTSVAIRAAIDEGGMGSSYNMIYLVLGALLIVYALWWLYFYQPTHDLMKSMRSAFVWAYGHWLIFGATAAVGAGLGVVIDQAAHHAEISTTAAGFAVVLPVAIYVVSLWVLQEHPQSKNPVDVLVHPVTAGLILLTPFTGQAVLLTGILLTILVVIRLVRHLE